MVIPDKAGPLMRLQRTATGDAVAEIGRDVAQILPYLSGCKTIVDIGAGVGIAAALLAKEGFQVTAVDRDQTREPTYGRDDTAYYSSLEVMRELFAANGVEVEVLETVPECPFDAAISLYSWGFHYPLKAYTPNAPVWILDVREIPPAATVIEQRRKSARVVIKGAHAD